MQWVNIASTVLAIILLVPVAVVCVECLVAFGSGFGAPSAPLGPGALRLPTVVLVPAHNEETCIGATLQSLLPQLGAGDRVLVVADNCTDGTAAVARELGVEVIERQNQQQRGKGWALAFGVEHLANQPVQPAVVVMVDGDCTLSPGAMDSLVHQVLSTNRPAQAMYLMAKPTGRDVTPRDVVSALAFLVRNGVRARGLSRLHLPCPLTGSGMAFPWEILSRLELGTDNLVEDLQLGVDLAIAGCPARFCEEARVTGQLPHDAQAAVIQRTRWEHGHLQTTLSQMPRLLGIGIRRMSPSIIALALDLCVPPLSLLVVLLMGGFVSTTIIAIAAHGSWAAPILLLAGISLLLASLTAAWARFGRATMPATSLLAVPFYVLWKLPIYAAFVYRRQTTWVKTPSQARRSVPLF